MHLAVTNQMAMTLKLSSIHLAVTSQMAMTEKFSNMILTGPDCDQPDGHECKN